MHESQAVKSIEQRSAIAPARVNAYLTTQHPNFWFFVLFVLLLVAGACQ